MFRLTRPFAVLLVIGLAACGGGTSATDGATATDDTGQPTEAPATDGGGGGGTGGAVDLCAVLTIEEVSAAAGVEVSEAVGANLGDGQSSCNYNTADGLAVAGHTFTTPESGVSPGDMFDANAAEGESVDGVGDDAVMTGDDNFPILFVKAGDSLYGISVLAENLDPEGKRQASIDLAKLAVDRLP